MTRQTENDANNQTTSGEETDEPGSPANFDQQSGAECYPMVIIEESEHQLVDHSGPPGTPTSDFRTGPDRRYFKKSLLLFSAKKVRSFTDARN